MDNSDYKPDQTEKKQPAPETVSSKKPVYKMRLFIAGQEPNSVIARQNIKEICSEHIKEKVELKVIDVFEDYTAAIEENILVAPALIIDTPKKVKIFGNLRNKNKVLTALELI